MLPIHERVRNWALEEAAKACEKLEDWYNEREHMKWPELRTDAEEGCRECAEAIRALVHDLPFSDPVAAPPLTDDQIVEIRDEHLPSQGERFDCIAFARAVLAAAK